MKKVYSALLVAALGVALAPAAMAANNAPKAAKTVDVKFKKGSYGAAYKGTIKGHGYDEYKFYAKGGQKLTVKVSGGNVEPYLFSTVIPDSVNLGQYSPELDKNGSYSLPSTGSYSIRIVQPRAGAINNKTQHYKLTISIR